MKAMFNGKCNYCGLSRPRCAHVSFDRGVRHESKKYIILCDDCRRLHKGKYTIHPKHRSRKES